MHKSSVEFRWLGVAGFECLSGGQALLVDPFLSRVPFRRLLSGRVRPDPALLAEQLRRADYVLVSHPHYDHVLDVPEIVRQRGARAFGSEHTRRLLAAQGAACEVVTAGDQLALGAFTVSVLPARHSTVLGRVPYTGALPDRLQPPLRVRDYRMDVAFSFLLATGGLRILDWRSADPGPAPAADVLLVLPGRAREHYAALLTAVQPRLVIPTHWDDFFRPVSQPLRASFAPPALAWPPLQRIDLARFARIIAQVAPRARVLVPELFGPLSLA